MIQSLKDALADRGYETLTPVQTAVADPDLQTSDLLVSAQTGSGKTVGFGLAIAPTLLDDELRFGPAREPLGLIIAPTRELALQVKRELDWLYAKAGAVVTSCVGGMDMSSERAALKRGAHIVVATPGRLRDHIMRGSLKTKKLRAVVLDEADEMLDLGFRDDLEFILGEAPEDRRTLLFSATVPKSIATLAQKYQNDAVRVVTKAEKSQHTDIEYHALNVGPRDSENAIINVLRYYEAPNAIVFCNTRAMVNRLMTRLSNRGFSVVALSGELSQNERSQALQSMRDGRARVCVATDVAARGIDLPNLELVIHADLSSSSETVLHRSGRTGRAGRKGVSALIVTPKIRRKAERLLGGAKVVADWGDAPSAQAVRDRDQERLMSDPTWTQEITPKESADAAALLELHTPEQIAAAYLRLHSAGLSAPEELGAYGAHGKPEPRKAFGPSVWFSIAGGRKNNAEPRRLLPMLCKIGNITKEDVGAIRVADMQSYVEIRQSGVKGFLDAIGPKMRVEEGAEIIQLDSPPKEAKQPRPPYKDKRRDGKPFGDKRKTKRPTRNDWDDNAGYDGRKSGQEPSKKKPKGHKIASPFQKSDIDERFADGAVTALKPKKASGKPKHKSKAAIAKGKKKKADRKKKS